jgi:hypothetical protein
MKTFEHGLVARRAIFAVAGTAIMALASQAPVLAQPAPPDLGSRSNGNAEIAGTPCETALTDITGAVENLGDGSIEGTFICANGSITVEYAQPGGSTRVLGNVFSGQSLDVSDLPASALEVKQAEIGLSPEARIASDDVPNTCLPRNGSADVYTDGAFQAHGNVALCYGRFIQRGGVPVEPVWSDWLRYVVRQNLTNRTNHELRVDNTSTSPRWIDAEIAWDVRESVALSPDPYITSGQFDIPAFIGGNSVGDTYNLPIDGAKTYHAIQTTTRVYDVVTGDSFIAATNLRMPDFQCPANNTRCVF